MLRRRPSIWDTPGLMEALRAMSDMRQYTAAQIARKLSHDFKLNISRNAVIGKAFRNNMATRGRPPAKIKPASQPRVFKEKAPPKIVIELNEPMPAGDVPEGCRFMHGEALNRNFCGAPTSSVTSSWCDYHARIVFNTGAGAPVGKLIKFYSRRAA